MIIFDGIDEVFEKDFAEKCEMLSIYGESAPRTTLDGEWTYEELSGDVDDECIKLVETYVVAHKNSAVYDRNLYKADYLAEKIKDEHDLIEVYNHEYDKHRSENKFGICWFDEWIKSQVKSIMKANLVGDKK